MDKQELNVQNELSVDSVKDEIITSFAVDTKQDKINLYNAMNSAENALKDHVNKTLVITGFIAHKVTMTQESTGEIGENIRCVFFDDKGHTYACTSSGVLSSMKKLIGIFGMPTKEEPYKIIPKMAKGRTWEYLTIELAK